MGISPRNQPAIMVTPIPVGLTLMDAATKPIPMWMIGFGYAKRVYQWNDWLTPVLAFYEAYQHLD